jgi:hypothetical protein
VMTSFEQAASTKDGGADGQPIRPRRKIPSVA